MTRSRFSLLGAALLATVGLMALFASFAHGEVGAKWLVLKGDGGLYSQGEIETNKETFKGEIENKSASLLATLLGVRIELLCTAMELVDALLGAEGSVKKGTKAKFTGCLLLNAETKTVLKGCKPHSNGAPVGTIETQAFHVSVNLVEVIYTVKTKEEKVIEEKKVIEEGKTVEEEKKEFPGKKEEEKTIERYDVALVAPDNETSKEFVELEMGETCALFETVTIFGTVSLMDCGGQAKSLEHLTTHLLSEYRLTTKLYMISKTNEATIDGSGNVSLVSGRTWTGDPA
jgi:hypothetical protein